MAGRPEVVRPVSAREAFCVGQLPDGHGTGQIRLGNSIRLAVLVLKKLPASRLVLFVASQATFDSSEVKSISRALREAKICVSIVAICPKKELGPDLCKTLANLIASLNSDGDTPCGATHSSSLFHVNCELEIEEVVDFVKSNRQGMEMDQVESIEGQQMFHSINGKKKVAGTLQPRLSMASSSCRTESMDALHHLSGDGFMHPWLPSYVNFPCQVLQSSPFLSFCYIISMCSSIANPPYKKLLGVQAGRMIGQKIDEDCVTMETMIGGDSEWLGSGEFWNKRFGQMTDGVEEIGAHWNHSTIDCFRGLEFQLECDDRLRSSQLTAHHKPIHLVADPAKGRLAFTQSLDGSGKLRLLWWKSSKTTTKEAGPAQNLFTVLASSGGNGVPSSPDLEIETIPSKCLFKAAENSDNRVLVLECQQYGACQTKPKHRRWFFWLQEPFIDNEGRAGASALAAKLMDLLHKHPNPDQPKESSTSSIWMESSEVDEDLSKNVALEQIRDTLAQLSNSRFERETERRRRRAGIVRTTKDEGPSGMSESIPLVKVPNDSQESQQDDTLMFDLD